MAVMLSIQNRASANTALPGVLAMQGSNPYPLSPHGQASIADAIEATGQRGAPAGEPDRERGRLP